MCSGSVGALAHFIERAGVATASISLIREQTEQVRPPRALWVPFALGRPLGSASDPGFQRNVIRAALAMLYSTTEPTIEDYPVEAPDEAGPGQWACPINFAPSDDQSLEARLLTEVARLRPWAIETRRARWRTLFGASGAEPDQVDEVARVMGEMAEHGNVVESPESSIEWSLPMPLLLRHLADDLRTFYHEALAGQPGSQAPNHDALNEWIFSGTALGDVLLALADHLTAVDTRMALLVRGFLIPEGHYRGGSAFAGPTVPIRSGVDD